jgi:hypothetical protein
VYAGIPLAFRIQLPVYIFRQHAFESIGPAVMPIPDDLSCEDNMGVVAFRMNLLPQKKDQPILSSGNLVHRGGRFPQPSLGSDLTEINGKNPGQLLHFPVDRAIFELIAL